MPNLLIVGPTNNGKTMIVEKFMRNHPSRPSTSGEHEQIPVITLQMPPNPDVRCFYNALLNKLNIAHFYKNLRVSQLEVELIKILHIVEVKLIIIDELHS
jgi:GTPase SAR1 family protein